MGVRYFGEANDINANTWKVEIHDLDFSGTPTEIKLGGGIFTQEFDGYDKLFFTQLQPSRCVVPIVVTPTDTGFDTFVQNLPLATENKYFILIYKGTDLYWIGNMLVDQAQYDDNKTYIVELTATDGLKRLENYYFNDINSYTPDYMTDLEIIQKALAYAGFEQFFGTGDVYIESAVNWYEVDAKKTTGTILETRTQRELLYEDIENLVPKKCSEVLEQVLIKYGAFIKFMNGRWVVGQFSNHSAASTPTYTYTKLQAVGTSTIGADVTLTGGNDSVNTLLNTFMPSLNRVELKQSGESEWVITEGWNPGFTSTRTATRTITSLADEQLVFSFEWIIRSTQFLYNVDKLRLIFNINDGTNYLYWNPLNNTASWTTNSSDRYWYDFGGYTGQANSPIKIMGTFTTPPVPTGATGTTITVSMTGSHIGLISGTTNSIEFASGSTRVSQYMGGVGTGIGTKIDQTTVAKLTTALEFSDVISEDLPNFEQTNNVEFVKQWAQIDNGTSWVNSSEWALTTGATSGILLAELLSSEAVYHQRYPLRKIQGGFRLIEFYTYDTLTWRSKRWVFLKGSFNCKMSEWTGEWVEYNRNATGSSVAVQEPLRDRLKRWGDTTIDLRDRNGGMDSNVANLELKISAFEAFLLLFNFDNSTAIANPGTGEFRLNSATMLSVTAMAVSDTTISGIQLDGPISHLAPGDRVYIQQQYDTSRWVRFDVDGSITAHTGWYEIPLTYIGNGSALQNGEPCTIFTT